MSNHSPEETGADAEAAEGLRRRKVLIAALLLLIGLPIYILVAATIVGTLTAPTVVDGEAVKPIHWLVELVIYVVLGLVWAFPLRALVQGTGKKAE